MASNRITAAVLLVAASIPALAHATPFVPTPSCSDAAQAALYSLLLPEPAIGGESAVDAATLPRELASANAVLEHAQAAPRELLAAFAMTLRDIRYRRGGRVPKTGFDCSGFVQYVFAHTLGVDLPDDSASQFRDGERVARNELKTGDLVFFRTRGKNVSHVGIYLGDGRFIHSPSSGKRVRIDELGDRYWAQRFIGAKRPDVLTAGGAVHHA